MIFTVSNSRDSMNFAAECTFCSLQQEFFSVLWTIKRIEYSLDVNGWYCAVFACGYRCFIELTQKKLVFMERFYSRIFETKTKSRYIENNLHGCKLRSRQIKITVNNEKRNICYSNVEVPTIPVTLLSSLRIAMCDFMALWYNNDCYLKFSNKNWQTWQQNKGTTPFLVCLNFYVTWLNSDKIRRKTTPTHFDVEIWKVRTKFFSNLFHLTIKRRSTAEVKIDWIEFWSQLHN